MKSFKHNIMTALVLQCLLSSIVLISCSDGKHINDNPFADTGKSYLEVEYSSNADSVFLSWSLKETLDFDKYVISDNKGKNHTEIDKTANTCVLTHIPYNEPVLINISMYKGNEILSEVQLTAKIDGLDKVVATKIMPERGGVTEGDGMYSIALPDGRSVFLMGDSYIGPITNGKRPTSDHMYRNTYHIYDDGKVSAIYGENNRSACVPQGVTNEGAKWYWPGHGFVIDNTLYVFQFLMYQGSEGAWGFMYETTHILEYNLPEITLNKTTRVPFYGADNIHYGAAALNDDGDLYIYAQVDIRNDSNPLTEVYVARTSKQNLNSEWEYYDGNSWTDNSASAKALEGLGSVAISSQFNVFKLNGKYVLLAQKKNFNSGEIYTFTSDTPYGPWGHRKLIYKIPALEQNNWFTYNAMGHPQFTKDGMILVTYNVNTGNFSEQFSNVYSYRPRFFWVEVNDILN